MIILYMWHIRLEQKKLLHKVVFVVRAQAQVSGDVSLFYNPITIHQPALLTFYKQIILVAILRTQATTYNKLENCVMIFLSKHKSID